MIESLFNPTSFRSLPLWAQVLLAARMVRRAALGLPVAQEKPREALVAGAEALEWCVRSGALPGKNGPADIRDRLARAKGLGAGGAARPVADAFDWAIDAALAAQDSTDFSGAESACTNSVWRALSSCAVAPGMSQLRMRMLLGADTDLAGFACGACDVGRYDPLPDGVFDRLTPVTGPDPRDQQGAC